MPGIYASTPRNAVIAKGFSLFQPDNFAAPFWLGNMSKCVYKTDVKQIDYYDEQLDTKTLKFSAIQQKGGTVSFELYERILNNLYLYFLGLPDVTDPTLPKLPIYSELEPILGQFWYYATNGTGPRWYMYLPRVIINPTGEFGMITDDWAMMPIEAKHTVDDDNQWGSMTLQPPISTIVPENVLLPFIDGPLELGASPTYAKVGEKLTANIGAWVAATQGIAYQWFANGSPISLATKKNYTPVSGDIGKVLSVEVFATNPNGTSHATSGNTSAVVS